MAQRRHHYEQAFEQYLRARRIPYISVNEARKALLPDGARLTVAPHGPGAPPVAIKSFDFVVYGESENLLIDIKGRRCAATGSPANPGRGRLESWVTTDDVGSMRRWMDLFGAGFDAVFVFIYWCEGQPPDALFQEIFTHHERWYAVRAVRLEEYARHMTTRSARWRTVHVPSAVFERISQPFAPAPSDAASADRTPGSAACAGGTGGAVGPAAALQPLGAGLSSR